jgi:hypothetical protein
MKGLYKFLSEVSAADFSVLVFYQFVDEWNASQVVRKLTQPEIVKRQGRIIEPATVLQNHKTGGTTNKKQKTQ